MFINPAILTNSKRSTELSGSSHWASVSDAEVQYHVQNASRMRSEAFRNAGSAMAKWIRHTTRQIFSAPSYVRHA
jgi:hypothetical protein